MKKYALLAIVLSIAAVPAFAEDSMSKDKADFKASLTPEQQECIKQCPKFTKEEKKSKSDAEWQAKRDCYTSCGIDKSKFEGKGKKSKGM